MKGISILSGLVLLVLITLVSAVANNKSGRVQMSQKEVLREVTKALELQNAAKLSDLDCKTILGYDTTGSAKCYASILKPEAVLSSIRPTLDALAKTTGWQDDYGVQGAFYAMNADPGMTFGVTVGSIEGSQRYSGVKELQGKTTVITVTADSSRKP